MARTSSTFVCQSCGNTTSKWSGRCEACGEWNTIVEEAPLSSGPAGKTLGAAKGRAAKLTDLSLFGNKIGDLGMSSLSEALAKGALANLKLLGLSGNPASDEAQQRAQ